MSWDDEDDDGFVATIDDAPAVSAWDDEDVDDSKLESWEDEDKPQPEKPKVQPGARKKKTQAELRAEKAARLAAERAAAAEAEAASKDPAKKLALRKLQEDSDLAAARDLFGVDGLESDAADVIAGDSELMKLAPSKLDKLEAMDPNTEEEFDEYAELLATYVTKHNGNYLYMYLIKSLMTKITSDFKSDEYKDLSAALSVLMNDKLAQEKKADGKKSKKKTKAKINKKYLEEDMIESEFDSFM